jgi:hypothetical protein
VAELYAACKRRSESLFSQKYIPEQSNNTCCGTKMDRTLVLPSTRQLDELYYKFSDNLAGENTPLNFVSYNTTRATATGQLKAGVAYLVTKLS